MQLKLIRNNKAINILDKVGNLAYSDSEETAGVEFSFDYEGARNGDIIVFNDGKNEVFRGIVVNVKFDNGSCKGYDFSWYLKKSETIIQYKNVSADKAIRRLLDRFNVPVGTIPALKTQIKKIYKDKVVYDIIIDILELVHKETKRKYKIEMAKGKFCIVKSDGVKIKPTFVDQYGKKHYSYKCWSINGERTIEELKNEVIIAGTSDKAKQIKAVAKSSSSIKKYGKVSVVETIENTNNAKARNAAVNKLKALNKERTKFSIDMLGGGNVRSGRLIEVNEPKYKLKGFYVVKNANHRYSNGVLYTTCEMEG
ncbi:MAG: hypothetical protein RSA49_04295 [Anaerovoracaceae bacterium]|uniref:XkdQ/YqbQ family protein n=1 Tax=Chryseobacterium sp. TaxID=1871047 RepID=UPI002FC7F361